MSASAVWGPDWYGQMKTLDVHIAAIRRKLAEATEATGTAGPGVRIPEIVTLRGRGYRFELP